MNSDLIALSARIRLARNLEDHAFPPVIRGGAEEKKIVSEVCAILKRMGGYSFYKMSSLSVEKKRAMVERYLISSTLAECDGGAVAVSGDGLVSVMINEEDHVREQCIVKGSDLYSAYGRLDSVDKILCGNLRFAKKGNAFLTTCPTNLGTGMRASVMVCLPALAANGGTGIMADLAERLGLTVRGAFGEGTENEGDLYQISNRTTLRVTPEKILESVGGFAAKVISEERKARYDAYALSPRKFEDDCLRALGILRSCVLLEYGEFLSLIGKVRLGVFIGFITAKNKELFDDLSVSARNYNLLSIAPGDESIAEKRAKFVKNALADIDVRVNT